MRKRLIVCTVTSGLGLVVALPIGDRFGLNPAEALIGCAVAGAVVGYVLSIFMDVFLGGTTELEN